LSSARSWRSWDLRDALSAVAVTTTEHVGGD
jgi:hypothetical protein